MNPDFQDTLYVPYTSTNTTNMMSDTNFLCWSTELNKLLLNPTDEFKTSNNFKLNIYSE